jgi:SOS-response transcriptional repressor LexA
MMRDDVQNKKAKGASDADAMEDPFQVLPPLTEKQGKCLEFILNYFLEKRYYPTRREVAIAMEVSSAAAEAHLEPLERKGYLVRESGRQRNMRLTPGAIKRLELDGINVHGRLAAA